MYIFLGATCCKRWLEYNQWQPSVLPEEAQNMPRSRNSCNNPMVNVLKKTVHVLSTSERQEGIVQSHANDVSPSHRRLLPIPNAARRHNHNFRSPMMQKANPDRRKNVTMYKLFHVTQGLLHQHPPRHRWATEDAQSELPLPHQLYRRSLLRQREWEPRSLKECRERGKQNKLPRSERGKE